MDQVSTINICLFSSKEENGYYQNIGQQSFILNLWGPGVFQHLEFFWLLEDKWDTHTIYSVAVWWSLGQ